MKYCARDGRIGPSVPRFKLGAVSVVLVGGVGSYGRLPRCFELVGAVSVVLVGGVDRCGRLPPHWWRQLQSSSLVVLAAAAAAVVVLLVSGSGSCSWCCGHPPPRWRWRRVSLFDLESSQYL